MSTLLLEGNHHSALPKPILQVLLVQCVGNMFLAMVHKRLSESTFDSDMVSDSTSQTSNSLKEADSKENLEVWRQIRVIYHPDHTFRAAPICV